MMRRVASNIVERLEKKGLEPLLGRDPRAARVGVHLRELGGKVDESLVHHVANRPQRMVRGANFSGITAISFAPIRSSGPRIGFPPVFS